MSPTAFLTDLRRAASWHRRLLAAGLAAGGVALGLEVLAPGPPPTTKVVVAARDVPAGAALVADDLATTELPPRSVPDGVLRHADALGRVVTGPVGKGEPITDRRVMGPGLVDRLAPGLVASPVRVADPGATRLLRPGDRIDVLAAPLVASPTAEPGEPAATIVRSATVLAVPEPGEEGVLAEGALVVLAVSPDTASTLAGAAVTARLSLVLRGP